MGTLTRLGKVKEEQQEGGRGRRDEWDRVIHKRRQKSKDKRA